MSAILDKFLSTITTALKSIRPPFPIIPPILRLCDINKRPGLSAISLGTSIIARLPEIGIPNGPNADGSENLINKYTMLIAEELVREIKENGFTDVAMAPGSIQCVLDTGTAKIPIQNETTLQVRGGIG